MLAETWSKAQKNKNGELKPQVLFLVLRICCEANFIWKNLRKRLKLKRARPRWHKWKSMFCYRGTVTNLRIHFHFNFEFKYLFRRYNSHAPSSEKSRPKFHASRINWRGRRCQKKCSFQIKLEANQESLTMDNFRSKNIHPLNFGCDLGYSFEI